MQEIYAKSNAMQTQKAVANISTCKTLKNIKSGLYNIIT